MTLDWSPARDRYEVTASYAERRAIKDAGFTYSPALQMWFSTRPELAWLLRQFATPQTAERLEQWRAKAAGQQGCSRQQDAEISIPAPEGCEYMPFQKAAIAYAASRSAVLLADEPGLGKTIQAIGYLNSLPKDQAFPVLVVCPASLKLNWDRELKKWLTHEYVTVAVVQGSTLPKADVLIVSYDMLNAIRESWVDKEWAVLIADEAHYAKNLRMKAGQWAGSARAKMLQYISRHSARKVFLTGSPMDRPQDLWAILVMLDPVTWGSRRFFQFARRYCAAHYNGFGWDTSGSSNLEELQGVLRSTVMVRRLKQDVLTDLPAKTRTIVPLEASPADLAADQQFLETFADDFAELQFAGDVGSLKQGRRLRFDQIAAARHLTAVRKARKVVEFSKEQLETRDKLIVFGHHADVIEALRAGLAEYNPVVVTGKTSAQNKQAAVDAFQNNPSVRVFIGNMQAAGVGITLTAASAVVFAELDWQPSVVSQAEDRAHRIGQRDNVQVFHVVLDRSIDAKLAKLLVEKQDVIYAALDKESRP